MIATSRIWLARALIGGVLTINIQSALVFYAYPSRFAPAYELIGIPGQTAIRGFGILFLMWTVPYVTALINPVKYRVSLFEAIAMQSIGLIGESLIYFSIPLEHSMLKGSIFRFIIFDSGGLMALISTAYISKSLPSKNM